MGKEKKVTLVPVDTEIKDYQYSDPLLGKSALKAESSSIDIKANEKYFPDKQITTSDFETKVASGKEAERIKAAKDQSWKTQAFNAVAGGTIKGALTFAENVGYLGDVQEYLGINDELDKGYSNWLSELAKQGKEEVDEAMPILQENPGKSFDWQDSGYIWKQIQGLVDSGVGFGLTGGAVGAVVGAGVKAAGATKLAQAILGSSALGEQAVTAGVSAMATNYAESKMMSLELFQNAYKSGIENGLNHQEASDNAADQANKFILTNKINTVTDYIALKGILNGSSIIQGQMDKTFKQKAFDVAKLSTSEAIEEDLGDSIQNMHESIAKDNEVNYATAIEKKVDPTSYIGRVVDYATSEKGLESAMLGVVGGQIENVIGIQTLKKAEPAVNYLRDKLGIPTPEKVDINIPKKPDPKEFGYNPEYSKDEVSEPYKRKILTQAGKNTAKDEKGNYLKGKQIIDYNAEQDRLEAEYNNSVEKRKAEKIGSKEYQDNEKAKLEYNAAIGQYEDQLVEYQNVKKESEADKRIGTVDKANEDIKDAMVNYGKTLALKKEAIINDDQVKLKDLENDDFENLFHKYASSAKTEGLVEALDAQINDQSITQEARDTAVRLKKRTEQMKKDWLQVHDKFNRTGNTEQVFKHQQRIASTKEALEDTQRELSGAQAELAKTATVLTGENPNLAQQELISLAAEKSELDKLQGELKSSPVLNSNLYNEVEDKKENIAKKESQLKDIVGDEIAYKKLTETPEYQKVLKLSKDKAQLYTAHKQWEHQYKLITDPKYVNKASQDRYEAFNKTVDQITTPEHADILTKAIDKAALKPEDKIALYTKISEKRKEADSLREKRVADIERTRKTVSFYRKASELDIAHNEVLSGNGDFNSYLELHDNAISQSDNQYTEATEELSAVVESYKQTEEAAIAKIKELKDQPQSEIGPKITDSIKPQGLAQENLNSLLRLRKGIQISDKQYSSLANDLATSFNHGGLMDIANYRASLLDSDDYAADDNFIILSSKKATSPKNITKQIGDIMSAFNNIAANSDTYSSVEKGDSEDVKRIKEQLQASKAQVDLAKAKVEQLDSDRNDLNNKLLEAVSYIATGGLQKQPIVKEYQEDINALQNEELIKESSDNDGDTGASIITEDFPSDVESTKEFEEDPDNQIVPTYDPFDDEVEIINPEDVESIDEADFQTVSETEPEAPVIKTTTEVITETKEAGNIELPTPVFGPKTTDELRSEPAEVKEKNPYQAVFVDGIDEVTDYENPFWKWFHETSIEAMINTPFEYNLNDDFIYRLTKGDISDPVRNIEERYKKRILSAIEKFKSGKSLTDVEVRDIPLAYYPTFNNTRMIRDGREILIGYRESMDKIALKNKRDILNSIHAGVRRLGYPISINGGKLATNNINKSLREITDESIKLLIKTPEGYARGRDNEGRAVDIITSTMTSGNEGRIVMDIYYKDGGMFPMFLNNSKLNDSNIEAVFAILEQYQNGFNPKDIVTVNVDGKPYFQGVSLSEALDHIVFSGEKSRNTSQFFNVDTKNQTIDFSGNSTGGPVGIQQVLSDATMRSMVSTILKRFGTNVQIGKINKPLGQNAVLFGKTYDKNSSYNDFIVDNMIVTTDTVRYEKDGIKSVFIGGNIIMSNDAEIHKSYTKEKLNEVESVPRETIVAKPIENTELSVAPVKRSFGSGKKTNGLSGLKDETGC